MDVTQFKKLPVMGILRGIAIDSIEPLADTIISAGLKTVEVTMNTANAGQLISRMVRYGQGKLTVGAGTVLNREDLRAAIDSGAAFIVLPVLITDVVEYCVKKKIPVFPGAFTPQEIYTAASCGATMVKVFPAKFFGPEYLREIKGPFNSIELLVCGGVTPENLESFFSCGASAVAFGTSVFKKELLAAGDFPAIEKRIKSYISAFYRVKLK